MIANDVLFHFFATATIVAPNETMVIWAILFLSIVRLKENCPDCRFEVSGAVRGYRPERNNGDMGNFIRSYSCKLASNALAN